MAHKPYRLPALAVLAVVLLIGGLYTHYQFRTYRALVFDQHQQFTRNAIIQVLNDLGAAERRLDERGEFDPYLLVSARANLTQVRQAEILYQYSTGHRLFPVEMHSTMFNALGEVLSGNAGPAEERILRDMVADWKIIYYETYTEEVLQRGDREELTQAYARLINSLRTTVRR